MAQLLQGLHPGIPMEVYLSDPAPEPSLSSGAIWTLNNRCPRAAWWEHPRLGGHDTAGNKATNLGTYGHAMLLGEGADDVVVIDRNDYPSKTGSIPEGWTNNAIRAARDAVLAAGKTPVLADDIGRVQEMVATARAYIASSEVPELLVGGSTEVVGIWQHGPIWCRMRADWISGDRTIILDYKTTATSAEPESWIRSQLVSMGYDIQADFYSRGLRKLCGTDPRFLFLVQEIEPPYLCSLVGMAPGMGEMASHKVSVGMTQWATCMKRGVWPAYSSRIAWAEPQNWQVTQWEERRAIIDLELAEQA